MGHINSRFSAIPLRQLECPLCWYGVTPIKKLKLIEPEEILRKQELKQEWSERRLDLKDEAKKILLEKKR
ncbi:hypothetical protein EEL30_00125 (plasmid) [Brevibacillus laterosporus]|uniref:Uncharacterized protein n=1 Tax=Brevibacillus laterosporus TaxID=1465 RepID=A0A518V1R0_BRELA|nr:hypothetical protein EEL30_00125 [Brevibacillus laterosporus]